MSLLRTTGIPNLATKTVKKGASIGAGSSILCGLTIGEDAVIGMGSVVTNDVPAGEVWWGNPARFIRKVNDKKQ